MDASNHESQRFGNSRSLDRMEALSDGIMAFAMTLLFVTIALPALPRTGSSFSFFDALSSIRYSILVAVIAFLDVAVFWSNHHHMCRYFERTDQALLMLNALFLMSVAFLPLATALLGESLAGTASPSGAAVLYGLTMMTMAGTYTLIWWYASGRGRLTSPDLDPGFAQAMTRAYIGGTVLFLVGIGVAVVEPWISLAIFFGIAAWFGLPRHYDAGNGRITVRRSPS